MKLMMMIELPIYQQQQRLMFIINITQNLVTIKKCECGHDYHRHFDGYDNNEAVGCKYCGCNHFK
jgi:hypothetical protein